MRSFGIIVVLLLWFLVLYKTYQDRKSCCSDSSTSTALPVKNVKKSCPICFKWQGNEPQLCSDWNAYRDSLVRRVSAGEYLEIKGLYIKNEINKGSKLAVDRAKAVQSLFSSSFAANSIRIESQMDDTKVKQTCRAMVEFTIKSKVNESNTSKLTLNKDSNKIARSGSKILVYFPYNSSNKISDSEIEKYLDELASTLISSKDRIRIEGHTDTQGASKENLKLGQRRADMVGHYLMKKGVTKSQIITISRGETRPIEDNTTEKGRAKNRRTELQIIKN